MIAQWEVWRFDPPTRLIAKFGTMRLIKRWLPNQLVRDVPPRGRFDSMGFGLVSFQE
jgi:hypothetical protein